MYIKVAFLKLNATLYLNYRVNKVQRWTKYFKNELHCIFLPYLAGTGDPYALSRPMTRAFLRDDILAGAESTPENLQRATERILEELQETFESSFVSYSWSN
jgi:hypothetical protein